MTRMITALAAGALLALAVVPALAGDRTPEETVRAYLQALQDQKFDRTYELVSKAMKTDRQTKRVKSKEQWVKESQYIFQFSEAKILDFEVFEGKIEEDKALVPNILSSQDKFLNQLAAEEYELYTLVKEDGEWKVDQQQVVVEPSELDKWFPTGDDDS